MSGYVLAGLILAGILVLVYLARFRGQGILLERCVEIFLGSQGVTAGIRVIDVCVTAKRFAPFSDDDRVYMVIGGFALIWASVASLRGAFKRR